MIQQEPICNRHPHTVLLSQSSIREPVIRDPAGGYISSVPAASEATQPEPAAEPAAATTDSAEESFEVLPCYIPCMNGDFRDGTDDPVKLLNRVCKRPRERIAGNKSCCFCVDCYYSYGRNHTADCDDRWAQQFAEGEKCDVEI